MKIFVITLPERKDQAVKEMDKLYPCEYTLFNATRNTEDPKDGIVKSYYHVVSVAKRLRLDKVLLFEDDVKFTSCNSRKYFELCEKNLPGDWDILLGGSYWYDFDKRINNYLIKVKDFCSLHCVLVRDKAFDKFPNSTDGKNLDRYLGKLSSEGKLNIYLCDPMVAVQYNGYSFQVKKNVNYDHYLADKNILR